MHIYAGITMNVLKEGYMLHKIMDMQLLLYAMAGIGALGILGLAAIRLSYKRKIQKSRELTDLKEKCLKSLSCRDELMHRMNRWVWIPSFISTLLLCLAAIISKVFLHAGMVSSIYFQMGLTVPVALLVVRQTLDFTHKEDIIYNSMANYIEESCQQVAAIHATAAASKEQEDAMVDYVAGGIRESARNNGRFGELLSPEEEEIMREVIREFMG